MEPPELMRSTAPPPTESKPLETKGCASVIVLPEAIFRTPELLNALVESTPSRLLVSFQLSVPALLKVAPVALRITGA